LRRALLCCSLIFHSYLALLPSALARCLRRPSASYSGNLSGHKARVALFLTRRRLKSSSIGPRRGAARIMRALDEPFGHRATDPLPTSASSSPAHTSTASRASRYHSPRQRRRNNASASTNPSSPALPLRRSSVAAPPYTIWRRHARGNRTFVLFFPAASRIARRHRFFARLARIHWNPLRSRATWEPDRARFIVTGTPRISCAPRHAHCRYRLWLDRQTARFFRVPSHLYGPAVILLLSAVRAVRIAARMWRQTANCARRKAVSLLL